MVLQMARPCGEIARDGSPGEDGVAALGEVPRFAQRAAGSNVTITTNDGASHTGATGAITVGTALVSTAGDGISDSWKIADCKQAASQIVVHDRGHGMSHGDVQQAYL